MELTKKQLILIAAISGAILLLTVAAILLSTAGDGEASVAPTAFPTQTASPTATPAATVTPAPTAFRLPLVPQWDTPRPTADMAGAFVPQPTASATDPPGDGSGPWVEGQGEYTQDILAVGLQEGRAAALLMLRLNESALTITALPLDEAPLVGRDIQEQGAQAAARAAAKGRRCGAWMALDLSCLPAVLEITGPLGDFDSEPVSAEGTLSLAMGVVACLQRVSLLKFPALKRAMGDAFASSLSTRELWSLFWTVRRGVSIRCFLDKTFFGESS